MDVSLVLNSGGQKGRETALARGIYLVGRSKVCQIRPKNRYVSRKHCALIHRRREVLIQDLGSRSGTFVNGQKIDPKVAIALSDGDRIRVGKTRFIIAILGQSGAPEKSGIQAQSPENGAQELEPALADSALEDATGTSGADNASGVPHYVDDVLKLLESDPDEDDEEDQSSGSARPGSVFSLGANAGQDADLEDDSDGNVVFAAPSSGEFLGKMEPLPSYASRKDWDVQSVYNWINQKETYSKLDERRAKRKAKPLTSDSNEPNDSPESPSESLAETQSDDTNEAEERYSKKERVAQEKHATAKTAATNHASSWAEWLDSDHVKPAVLAAVGIVFATWVLWNVWLLISFKG